MNARLVILFILFTSSVSGYTQDSLITEKKGLPARSDLQVPFKQVFMSPVKLTPPKNYADSFLRLTQSVVAPLKNPVVVNDFQLSYDWLHDNSYLNSASAYSFGNFNATADAMLGGIPAGIAFQNQTWSDVNKDGLSNFSFRFDKDQYLEGIKKKLSSRFDPASLVELGRNKAEELVKSATQELQADILKLNASYGGILSDDLKRIGDLQTLFKTDINEVKKKLYATDVMKGIKEKENQISLLQQKINNGEKISVDEMNALQKEIARVKAVDELIEKITTYKARWEQSGLIKKLKELDLLQKDQIARLIKDPSTIRRFARQYLSLRGVQKFFLNVNQLDIGKSAQSITPLSFQHFLNNGIVGEFTKDNGKTLSLLFGKQKDFNSILDYAFTDNLNSNNSVAKAITLGKSNDHAATRFSLSSFNQSPFSMLAAEALNNFRQVLVTTISQHLTFGEKRSFDLDLSKSATQYQGSGKEVSSVVSGANMQDMISGKSLLSNTAISLQYADEYPQNGLRYQASFRKVTNGYNNPGNTFLSGGSTEAGLMLRKSLLKNKMLIAVRGNTRWYKYSDRIDDQWRNSYYVFDLKWKLKKGQNISLRYQPSRMLRIEQSQKSLVTAVERLSIDANLFKRISKVSYSNYISLTHQKNIFANVGSINERNRSWMINSYQNITVGKQVFYINTNYNYTKNSSSYLFFNSSFFTEAGYSYRIFRNITASTGYIYNSIKGWYRQTGIRQTISGQLGERFSVDLYLDAKRNLQVSQSSLWDDPLRANVNLRYTLQHTSPKHETRGL